MTEIKYICFDIGSVACYGGKKERIERGKEIWGSDFDKPAFKKMMKPKLGDDRDRWREYQNGQISSDEYLSAAVRSGGLEDTLEERENFKECLEIMAGKPYQPMVELAGKLKEAGYHISVLTNNNDIMYAAPASEIVKHADVIVSSNQIGISKSEDGGI